MKWVCWTSPNFGELWRTPQLRSARIKVIDLYRNFPISDEMGAFVELRRTVVNFGELAQLWGALLKVLGLYWNSPSLVKFGRLLNFVEIPQLISTLLNFPELYEAPL